MGTQTLGCYSASNSTKSPTSGAGNVSEPRLMSQVGRVREFVCAWISVFLQPELWKSQYSSAHVAAAIMRLRQDGRKVCEIRAEGSDAK